MLKRSAIARTLSGALVGALAAILFGWTASLPAQEELPLNHPPQAQMAWSTIGAVGVPDDGDAELIRFGANGAAAIADGLSYPVEAVLRYNVVSVLGLYAAPENRGFPIPRCLTVGYRDNGPGARVIATVKRVVGSTGQVQTFATFDSDFFPDGRPRGSAGNIWTDAAVCPMGPGTFAGMNQNAFFVEVQLIRTTVAGNPGLQTLFIEADPQ